MRQRSLLFNRPLSVEVREGPLPKPAPDQVQVATRLSAISAGTELLVFRGLFPEEMAVDASIGSLSGRFTYPLAYGYSCVGEVTAAGAGVDPYWIGRRVFAFHPHDSHFVVSPEQLLPLPAEVGLEDGVFLAAMETAVNLVMDGRPVIGERVMVWGLGVVGLLTTAVLGRFPLALLAGVDPVERRRQAALDLGAHLVSTGMEPDGDGAVAESFSRTPGDGKADLIFELSGNPQALNAALRWSGFHSRIVIGSWYGAKSTPIDLGGRYHRDRVAITSSQVSTLAPRFTGRWSKARRFHTAWQMVRTIRPSTLITHRFDIREAQSAYDLLADDLRDGLQAVLTYPAD